MVDPIFIGKVLCIIPPALRHSHSIDVIMVACVYKREHSRSRQSLLYTNDYDYKNYHVLATGLYVGVCVFQQWFWLDGRIQDLSKQASTFFTHAPSMCKPIH